MFLKATDQQDALISWIKSDIQDTNKHGHELGKFFFGVSVGTMGLLATLQKLNPELCPAQQTFIPYLPLFISLLVALVLAAPRTLNISDETDLRNLHKSEVTYIKNRVIAWFLIWLVGAAVSIWVLF